MPPAQADTETGTLPGGTSISVSIDNPADGALVPSATGDIALNGSASVGQGQPASTTLIYVVDASGSTAPGSGGDCGGDQDGDTNPNSVLDCEIAAARALNQEAIAAGTVDQVGVVFFEATAGAQDVSAATDTQTLVAPAHDDPNSNNGIPDVEDRLRTVIPGGLTNLEAAVQSACALAGSASNTNPHTIIAFMSDGFASAGGAANDDAALCPPGATIQTFAIGSPGDCGNDHPARSLDAIAEATGGVCTRVIDVSTLPDVMPPVVLDALLFNLVLTVDGGAPIGISSSATPSLPHTSVSYSTTVPGLGVGPHTLCVTAIGTDGGGEGSIEDCHSFIRIPSFVLTVTRSGTGQGTVTSSPAGIACGADCSETYASGQMVTLTATPAAGSEFAGFTGAGCSTSPCTTTIASDTAVDARFEPGPDLQITKTDSADPVTVGSDISYTLSVQNNGPSDATAVEATDVLPAGVTFKSDGTTSTCTNVAGTVSCDFGTVAGGATETATIAVTANAVGTVSNTATIDGAEADPAPGNDSSTEQTTVSSFGGGDGGEPPPVKPGRRRRPSRLRPARASRRRLPQAAKARSSSARPART